MATGATGQLGLALPVQGELSGTWGDTVNNGITQYTNIAIAGTLTLTGDGAVTLSNTTGDASASNIVSTLTGAGTVTAQFAIVRVTGTLTTAKIITGPSYSKTYLVVNAATGSTVSFIRSGQTPAISIAVGESALVYFNGTDYVKLTGTATAGAAGGSTTQVQFNSSGVLAGSANMTFNGTTLTVNDLTDSSLTATRVTYAGTAGNLVDSANLTFNGTTLTANTIGAFTLGGTIAGGGNQINNVIIGTTTPLAGAFTTLSATGLITATAGVVVGTGAGTYVAGSLGFSNSNEGFVYRPPVAGLNTAHNFQSFGGTKILGITEAGAVEVFGSLSATGVATFAAGTAALPALTTTGDTNTGIFFPAADTVATSVGGSERMRIQSDGKVGIGTSSPYATLQIGSGGGGGNIPLTSKLMFGANNSIVTFLSANDAASVDGEIGSWNTVYNHQNAKIVFDKPTGNTGQILFYTQAGAGITERFRIASDGAFGLSGANYGTNGQVLTSSGSGAAPTWTTVSGGGSQWTTSGTQIYYNTGNVGIGTTSPDTYTDGGKNLTILSSTGSTRAQLAIVGTQSTANEILGRITFTNTNSTNTNYRVALIDGLRGSDNNSGHLAFSTGYTTNASERMRIDEFGNVAINNITPTSFGKFSVRGAISVSGVPGQTSGHFSDASSGSIFITHASGVVTLNSDTALAFGSSLSEKARIDTSGRFMVGTTTALASANFSVDGTNSDFLSRFYNSNASPSGTLFYYSSAAPNGTSNWFIKCQDTSAERMYVRSNGGIGNYQGNDANLSDRREKTNFAPAKNYLDIICSIPIQTFNYIDQNHEDDPGLTLGVVAQDVQEVAPELVMESDWGTEEEPKMRLSIYQTDLQYALMKCIQEQQAIIESLKARLDAANL